MKKIKVVSMSHREIYEETLNACYDVGLAGYYLPRGSYNPNGNHGKVG